MEKLIKQEYANRLAGLRGDANQRQNRLAVLSPEYAALREEYLELQRTASRAAVSGEGFERAMERVEHHYQSMQKRLPDILAALGLPGDYLNPQYECDICKDTGFVGGYDRRLCSCAKARLHSSDDAEYRNLPSFAAYDEGIFRDAGQREKTGKLKAALMAYAEDFPHMEKPNIFINSAAGLGKTFLLGCTTRAIGERGYGVKMLTAYELTALFKGEHIDQQPCMGRLKRLDFLVIDDLGVEPIYKNISLEYMFILLNERIRSGKPTAISSNLRLLDLQEKYGERIMSRVLDKQNGRYYKLEGKDLRLGAR